MFFGFFLVYYEVMKRELNKKLVHECRVIRLKAKDERDLHYFLVGRVLLFLSAFIFRIQKVEGRGCHARCFIFFSLSSTVSLTSHPRTAEASQFQEI